MLSEYCSLSTDSAFEVAPTAGHDIAGQEPEVVLSVIRRMLSTKERKNRV